MHPICLLHVQVKLDSVCIDCILLYRLSPFDQPKSCMYHQLSVSHYAAAGLRKRPA